MVKVSQRSDELRIYRVEKGERGNFGRKGSTMQRCEETEGVCVQIFVARKVDQSQVVKCLINNIQEYGCCFACQVVTGSNVYRVEIEAGQVSGNSGGSSNPDSMDFV